MQVVEEEDGPEIPDSGDHITRLDPSEEQPAEAHNGGSEQGHILV
jgi:hypothetical protein